MVGSLMILNPTRRRKTKATATKKRRRKMTPAQLKYFGKGRKRKASAKKKKRQTVIIATSNPRRGSVAKRRRKGGSKRRKFHRNPVAKRRRFRRNPIGVGYAMDALMPAAIGALGAIGVEFAVNNLPIPAQFQQGMMLPITKVALAFGLGAIASAALGESMGRNVTAGALVVTAYNFASQYTGQLTGNGAGYGNGQGGGYGYGNGYGGQGRGMRRYMGRVRRRGMGAGPMMKRRRKLGALPGGGVRMQRPNNYAPQTLARSGRQQRNTNLGYIGPARTLGRYVDKN